LEISIWFYVENLSIQPSVDEISTQDILSEGEKMNLQFIERGRYRNYDQDIKRQIMESGNPNLFPEMNIRPYIGYALLSKLVERSHQIECF